MEYELRFLIEDPEQFFDHLSRLDAKINEKEPPIDLYYRPKGYILPNDVSLRLRTFENTGEIIYQKSWIQARSSIEFKASDGKIVLFSGDINKAKEILENLGFEEFIKIKKLKLIVVSLNDLEFAYDEIDGLGSFVEIEAKTVDELISGVKKFVQIFGIRKYCPNSILEVYSRKINDILRILEF